MRKLITIMLVIMLLATLAFTLIACVVEKDPITPPDNGEGNKPEEGEPGGGEPPITPPVPPIVPPTPPNPGGGGEDEGGNKEVWSYKEAFSILGNSFGVGSDKVNFKNTLEILVGPEKKLYKMNFSANMNIAEKGIELVFDLIDVEANMTVFGIYALNNALYISSGDLKLHLEDVDLEYIIGVIRRVLPVIPAELDKLLGSLGGLDGIMNLVLPMLFTDAIVEYNGNIYDMTINFTLYNCLNTVIELVKGLGLDDLLAGLGVKLPFKIQEIIDMIKIPEFNIVITSKLEKVSNNNYKNLDFKVNMTDGVSGNLLNVNCIVELSDTKLDIGLPTSVAEYEPFSITNLAFNLSFVTEINQLDIATIVNAITGTKSLDLGKYILTSNLGFVFKFKMDLDLEQESKNLLLIELYRGKNKEDAENMANYITGIYYIDGTIKVNLDRVAGNIKLPNIEIRLGFDITGNNGLLTKYINMLVTIIDEALDGFAPQSDLNKSMARGASDGRDRDLVVSVRTTDDGALTPGASIMGFVNAIIKMIGFNEHVIIDDTGVHIKFNSKFLDVLYNLAPNLKDTIGEMGDFGDVSLDVNFSEYGIDNVTIGYAFGEDKVTLKADNFYFFMTDKKLRGEIESAIRGKEYVNSVKDIVMNLLNGVQIEGNIKLTIKKDTYNINELLEKFGLAVAVPDLILDLPNDLVINAKLLIQLKYDPLVPSNSKALIELHCNEDFMIFKTGKIFGIYAQNGKTYVDLSGIEIMGGKLPKATFDFDLIGMLASELDKIDMNLILSEIIPGMGDIIKTADSGLQDRIDIVINEDAILLKATSKALINVLAMLGINITLPDFSILLEVTDLNDIKLSAGLTDLATLDLHITSFIIGGNIEIPDINDEDYRSGITNIIKGAINDLLTGVTMDFNAKLKLKNNILPIGDLLAGFGVPGVPNIVLDIDGGTSGGVVLNVTIRFQLQYDPLSSSASKFLLEFILNEQIAGIKPGILLGVYGKDAKTFIDMSGLMIDQFSMPKMCIEIDIVKMLADQINGMNFDDLLDGIFSAKSIDKMNDKVIDHPIISINQTSLAIAISSAALANLLSNFGVMINLPELDLRVEIDANIGMSIIISNSSLIELDLSLKNISLGNKELNIDLDYINDIDFPSSLSNVLKNTVARLMQGMQVSASLKLDILKNSYNFTDLLAPFDVFLPIDLILNVDKPMTLNVRMDFKMQYDPLVPENSMFSLELYLLEDFFLPAGMNAGLLMAIYGQGKSMYVDMSGIVIDGWKLPKFRLNFDVMQLIMEQLDKIEIDHLLDGIYDILPMANEDSGMNGTINQDRLAFKLSSIALQTLLNNFAIGIELPFEFDFTIDLNFVDPIEGFKIILDTDNVIDLMLQLNNFKFGQKPDFTGFPESFPESDYSSTVSDAIAKTVEEMLTGTTMTAHLQITMPGGKYDLNDLLKKLGLTGTTLPNIAINVPSEQKLDVMLKLNIQYNKTNASASKFSLEIFIKSMPLFLADFIKDKNAPFIAIYGANAQTYIDLSNFVFANYRLPKINIPNLDLMGILVKQLESLTTIDDLINKELGSLKNMSDESQDAGSISKPIDIVLSKQAISILVSAQAFAEILSLLDMGLTLPEIDMSLIFNTGDLEFSEIIGMQLYLNMYDYDYKKFLTIDFQLKDINIGDPDNCPPININTEDYIVGLNNSIKELVHGALNGIDISANVNLTLPRGSYDFSQLGEMFGLEKGLIPPLVMNLNQDLELDIRLNIASRYDKNNPINSQFLFEIVLNKDVMQVGDYKPLLKKGVLIKLFIHNGASYVDLSGITIANVTLPRMKIDIDFFGVLNKMLEGLDLDKILDDLLNPKTDRESAASHSITNMNDADATRPRDYIDVEILDKAIILMATQEAFKSILAMLMPDLELTLPNFDIKFVLGGLQNIELKLSVDNPLTGNVEDKLLTLGMKLDKFEIGADVDISRFTGLGEIANEISKDLGTKLKFAIYDVIKTFEAELRINMTVAETTTNMTEIINRILAPMGQRMDIPINLNIDNLNNQVMLRLVWNLDFKNHVNSEAIIHLYTADGSFDVRILYKDMTLYIDLSRLGLMKFKIENFNLTNMIDKILTSNLDILNTDPTKIIKDLIDNMSGSKSMSYIGSTAHKSIMAEQMSDVAAANTEFDLISIILKNLNIVDMIASINIDTQEFRNILAKAGVSIGMPVSIGGKLVLSEGLLDVNISIDKADLGLQIQLMKLGGKRRPLDWKYFTDKFILKKANATPTPPSELGKKQPSELADEFLDYGSYSMLSAFDLVGSIFTSIRSTEDPAVTGSGTTSLAKLNLTAINNANTGTSVNQVSARLYRVMDYRTQVGGYSAARGSIIIALFKGTGDSTHIVDVVLDPSHGVLSIQGKKGLFDAVVVNASVLNINIALDIKSMLGNLLDPIFKQIPPGIVDGSVITTQADTSVLAEEAPGLDIAEIIKSITLSLTQSGAVKIEADLALKSVSDMLVEMLDGMLRGMGASYADKLEGQWSLFDTLWDNVLIPLIRTALKGSGDIVANIAPLVKTQIFDVVRRILPLPRFTDAKAEINIIDGKVANVFLDTRNTTPGQTHELMKMEIYSLYGAENNVDWDLQSTNIIHDPYNNSTVYNKFKSRSRMFQWHANRHENWSNNTWAIKQKGGAYDNVNPTVVGYDANYTNQTFINKYGTVQPDGTVIFEFRATAFGKQLPVKVSSLQAKPIVAIKDIFVDEYGALPSQVEAVFEDGTSRFINATILGAPRKGYGLMEYVKDETTPTASSHVIVKGKAIGVNVTYLDGTITTYQRVVYSDGYSKNNFVDSLPSRLYYAYEPGYYSSQRIEWDLSAMPPLDSPIWREGNAKGDEIILIGTVMKGNATLEQKLEFKLIIQSTLVVSASFAGGSVQDTLTLDPFNVINSDGDTKSIVPSEAEIIYTDGHSNKQEIGWMILKNTVIDSVVTPVWVPLTVKELNEFCSPEGGLYSGKLKIFNVNGDVSWEHIVDLEIARRVPKYISFGKENGEDIKKLKLNPYNALIEGIENVMPNKALVVFEKGDSSILPIAWDYSGIDLSPVGGSFLVKVKILPGTSIERTVIVPVEVEKVEILDLALENNTYYLNEAALVAYGGKTVADFTPKKLPFRTENNEIIYMDAVVDFSNVVVNAQSTGEFSATARIGGGKYEQVYTFKVIVPQPKATAVALGSEKYYLSLNEFRLSGLGAFPSKYSVNFHGINHTVDVKWNVENVEIIDFVTDGTSLIEKAGIGGIAKMTIGEKSLGNQQEFRIMVVVVDDVTSPIFTDSGAGYSISYNDYVTNGLPNTWKFNVNTYSENTNTGEMTNINHIMELPIKWNLNDIDIYNPCLVEMVLYAGTSREIVFSVRLTITGATEATDIVSKTITIDYADYLEQGTSVLPRTILATVGGKNTMVKIVFDGLTSIDFAGGGGVVTVVVGKGIAGLERSFDVTIVVTNIPVVAA